MTTPVLIGMICTIIGTTSTILVLLVNGAKKQGKAELRLDILEDTSKKQTLQVEALINSDSGVKSDITITQEKLKQVDAETSKNRTKIAELFNKNNVLDQTIASLKTEMSNIHKLLERIDSKIDRLEDRR